MKTEDSLETRKRLEGLLKELYQPNDCALVTGFLERFSDLVTMVRAANIFIFAAKQNKRSEAMDAMERMWRYVWSERPGPGTISENIETFGKVSRELGIPSVISNSVSPGPLKVFTIDSEYLFGGETVGRWRLITGRKHVPVIIRHVALGDCLELTDPSGEHKELTASIVICLEQEVLAER